MKNEDLQNMTLDELRALKESWIKRAKESGVLPKIADVARFLGERQNASYGPKYRWEHGEIVIYVDDYGKYFTVTSSGTQVCHGRDRVHFIPGEWENEVSEFFPAVEREKERREAERIDRERQELIASMRT
jgi:hypothetical protein